MKKEVLGFVIFLFLMVVMVIYGIDRFKAIDEGRMIIVSQSEMDR